MATSKTFTVKFDGDTKGLVGAFKDIQKQAGIVGKGVQGATNVMKTALAGVSVYGVVRGMQSMVLGASGLQESISKTNAVFGENAKQIQSWAKTTAKSFGVSERAALEAAGTYGNLFQAFGIAQGPAQDMSKRLVELAADMASFNNVPIDDALTALRSGLSGETEPLKRFGVALNDNRLKAEAMNLGIYNGKGILDTATKAQAAYALILKDTALQQGDVARTSGGFANQMKFLQASMTDVRDNLGAMLLPALTGLVNFLNTSVIPILKATQEAFTTKGAGEGVKTFQNQLGQMISKLEGAAKSIYNLITFAIGLKVAIPIVSGLRVAFDLLTNAEKRAAIQAKLTGFSIKSAMISTGIGALVVLVGFLVQAFIDAYMTSETFRARVNNAISALISPIKALIGWIGKIGQALGLTAEAAVYIDAAALSATRASDKMTMVNKATLKLGQASAVVTKPVTDLAGAMSGGAGGKAVDAAAEAAKKAIDGFKDSLDNAKTKLSDAQSAFKDFSTEVSKSIKDTLNFDSAISTSRQSIKDAADASAKLAEAQSAYQKAMQTNDVEAQTRALDDLKIAQDQATASVTGKKTFLQVLQDQAAKANEFGTKVKDLIKMGLSEAAIQQVLAAGADAGTAIADEIIAGGATVVDQVNTLITATQSIADQVGQAGAEQFYAAGVAQGQAMVQGVIDAIKAAGLTIEGTASDTIAKAAAGASAGAAVAAPKAPAKSKSTAKKTVTTKPNNKMLKIPMMAKGGIVTAPTLAIIGEAGPEAVVPLNKNNTMGNQFNITVNAGMGADGALIGREIIDAIKRYERASGPVFKGA